MVNVEECINEFLNTKKQVFMIKDTVGMMKKSIVLEKI